tara:strand:+ start:317 stop:1258 length:942 start_codon:yes stop_codon:yes gene_type:complete
MKPVLVLKQDVFTQIGPFQVPLSVGESSSNLRYQPGPDRLKPHESFITQSGELGLEPTKDKDAQRLAALGAPTTLSGRTLEEQRGWAQRAQARYDKKMPYQERLARGHAQRSSNTQQAFNEALRRTGRGALAGKIAAGAFGGLAGLLALQRANESGTDLISALGSAGTQGYLTHQQLSPALQRAGMRASMIKRPSVGVSSSTSYSADGHNENTGENTTQGTLYDPTETIHNLAYPPVAEPTVNTGPLSEAFGPDSGMYDDNNPWGDINWDEAGHQDSSKMGSPSDFGSVSEDKIKHLRGAFGKGNRRSFIGVR